MKTSKDSDIKDIFTKSVVNKFGLFNNFDKVRIKLNNTKNHNLKK